MTYFVCIAWDRGASGTKFLSRHHMTLMSLSFRTRVTRVFTPGPVSCRPSLDHFSNGCTSADSWDAASLALVND